MPNLQKVPAEKHNRQNASNIQNVLNRKTVSNISNAFKILNLSTKYI